MIHFWRLKKGPSTTSSAPHALPGRKDTWQGGVASYEGLELGGVHTTSSMLATAQESTAIISGSDSAVAATPEGGSPTNLHHQKIIAHPPMLRSTYDHLSVRRMKRWAHHETAQQNHRGAAQNTFCVRSERSAGLARRKGSQCKPSDCPEH